jgi:hypothetical protein
MMLRDYSAAKGREMKKGRGSKTGDKLVLF